MSFSDADLRPDVKYPHCNALVIHAVVGNYWVKRILADDGSSTDIITYDVISEMGLSGELKPFKIELYDFGNTYCILRDVSLCPSD